MSTTKQPSNIYGQDGLTDDQRKLRESLGKLKDFEIDPVRWQQHLEAARLQEPDRGEHSPRTQRPKAS